MPTINQLIRKGRVDKVKKSDSPALNKGYNSFKKSSNKCIFSTKTWCLHACWYNDTEETELGSS